MTIYEHKTSLLTSAGSSNTVTLNIRGGLCRFIYVQANTLTTVFRTHMTDEDGDIILSYGFHTGTLRDTDIALPMSGKHTLTILNASPNDTFKVKMRIEE